MSTHFATTGIPHRRMYLRTQTMQHIPHGKTPRREHVVSETTPHCR